MSFIKLFSVLLSVPFLRKPNTVVDTNYAINLQIIL